jgi:integrase
MTKQDDNTGRLSKETIKNPPRGTHADGGGLYLRHQRGCSWLFKYGGKRWGERSPETVTIGPCSKISYREASDRAAIFRQLLREGTKSPKQHIEQERIERKKQIRNAVSFGDAIEEYYNHGKGRLWVIDKRNSCSAYFPRKQVLMRGKELLKHPLRSITADDLAEYIYTQDLWDNHPATVTQIASFLIGLFSRAIIRRRYDGTNPSKIGKHSELVGIRGSLPPIGHLRDLPFQDIPLLMYHLLIAQHERRPGFISVAEAAAAVPCTSDKILMLRKKIPGCYKERNHQNAPWYLPIVGLQKHVEFTLPLPSFSETDIELYYRMIAFQILCVVRPEQVVSLRWRNVDRKKGLLIFRAAEKGRPGEHKMGHHTTRVYTSIITPQMAEILNWAEQRRLRDNLTCKPDDFVFTHERTRRGGDVLFGKPTQTNTLLYNLYALLKRIPEIEMKKPSIHAMRDAFTTWAAGEREAHHDLINLTLGHPVIAISQNKANDPYWKNVMAKLEEKRRPLMQDWENFALSMWNEMQSERESEPESEPAAEDNKVVSLRPSA